MLSISVSLVLSNHPQGTLANALYATVMEKEPLFKGVKFDCNGDGLPDSVTDLVAQYTKWSPYFMTSLRQRLALITLISKRLS